MKQHEKCIRALPYSEKDEIPMCQNYGCTCILLPGEKYCPGCLEKKKK